MNPTIERIRVLECRLNKRAIPAQTIRASGWKAEFTVMKNIKVHTSAGKEYGCIPGNHYHDVDVMLQRSKSGTWTSKVVETWGSNQGYREEHGRKTVAARAAILEDVVCTSFERAQTAGMHISFCLKAIARAEAEAGRQEVALLQRKWRDGSKDLSRFSTEELLAEIHSRGNSPLGEGSGSKVQVGETGM